MVAGGNTQRGHVTKEESSSHTVSTKAVLLTLIVNYTIAWLSDEYKSVFTNGSGMMKVARGKVHKYLGMMLDFATSKIIKVTMLEYVDEIIGSWDKACCELNNGYKAVSGC